MERTHAGAVSEGLSCGRYLMLEQGKKCEEEGVADKLLRTDCNLPFHKGVGTRRSLRSLPTKIILWFSPHPWSGGEEVESWKWRSESEPGKKGVGGGRCFSFVFVSQHPTLFLIGKKWIWVVSVSQGKGKDFVFQNRWGQEITLLGSLNLILFVPFALY